MTGRTKTRRYRRDRFGRYISQMNDTPRHSGFVLNLLSQKSTIIDYPKSHWMLNLNDFQRLSLLTRSQQHHAITSWTYRDHESDDKQASRPWQGIKDKSQNAKVAKSALWKTEFEFPTVIACRQFMSLLQLTEIIHIRLFVVPSTKCGILRSVCYLRVLWFRPDH